MSELTTCKDSDSIISLLESALGLSPSAAPDGQMTGPLSPDPARVSLSVLPEPVKEPLTNDTCGPTGSGSSKSYALQSFLESRLRARLPLPGLTLYRLTWKTRATPLGRQICAPLATEFVKAAMEIL
jgi:hypothetical protein